MRAARSILITGASSGIGAALANAYAAPGVHLALTGRNQARLDDTRAAVSARGATCDAACVDVTDRREMDRWIARCDAEHPLDLVVANAGISPGTSAADDEVEQTRRVFAVNIGGVVDTVLAALPGMTARGSGQIAIMASLAAFAVAPDAHAYCASKFAVRAWGEGLRGHLARRGIAVSVICPGFVESRMTAVNPHPKPGLIDADRAAAIIMRGLAANRGRIVFPWWLYAISRVAGALPPDLLARLARQFRRGA
ncbi:MAG: SDR family NAD(P)-dependent oxidoreductase [Alphaproteobacteria bacterium]|nr:SDR family NAD(P)-dependent oxidoreductase [Alphaproteobacteria bacterium]